MSYFYNSVTKVSTYDRPASLPASSPAPASVPASKEAKEAKAKKWQTYTDEATGKKYYSDGKTTTWNRPPELPPLEEAAEKKTAKRASSSETPRKKKRTAVSATTEESPYTSKAEATAAFKGLLLLKDIAPTTKWSDVLRICQEDARWNALATSGERKQALAEYQTKRANELRDVKRQEKTRAREAFSALLTEKLPKSSKFKPGSSRFMDVRDTLSKDDRFYAVEDETSREELFYDWVEELRKRDERGKRSKRREAKENCLKFFKGKEDEGKLTFASTW